MKYWSMPWLFGLLLLAAGCAGPNLGDLLNPPLNEQVLDGVSMFPDGKVLVLDISGEITSRPAGLFGHATTPDGVARILSKAKDEVKIKGLVLRIDSPGGEVTASDLIYREILDYKKATGVPVYASILGLGCSGSYYISMAADQVYAHPTSVVGSIGVIARLPQVGKLADKIGYDELIVKSGPLKDMGNPLRPLTKEEQQVFQNIIDDMYNTFLRIVVEHRQAFKNAADLRPIADGRVYTATQAQANGLVDDLVYLPDVLTRMTKALGLKRPQVISYVAGPSPDSSIYSRMPPAVSVVKLDLGPLAPLTPGFYYLWLPAR